METTLLLILSLPILDILVCALIKFLSVNCDCCSINKKVKIQKEINKKIKEIVDSTRLE